MPEDKLPISIDTNHVDYVVATLKGLSGFIPGLGSLVAEVIGTFIPNQRLDRLARYISVLEGKLSHLDQDTLKTRFATPGFLDLFEDSLYQAVRALGAERLKQIASLVKNGLTDQHEEYDRYKYLLTVLAEMNDTEVIILQSYLYTEHGGRDDNEFFFRHNELLSVPGSAHLGSSQETIDRATVHKAYRQHLSRLGVLRPNFRRVRKGEIPEFDSNTGMMKASDYELTPLGQLLLQTLDYGWPQCQDHEMPKIRWNEQQQQHRLSGKVHLGRRAMGQALMKPLWLNTSAPLSSNCRFHWLFAKRAIGHLVRMQTVFTG